MKQTLKTPTRLFCAVVLSSFVAACGGSENTGVRDAPQAVHPSPSALAQGTAVKSDASATCHQHGNKGCHSHGNDGSQPILH